MNNENADVRSLSLSKADKDYLKKLVQWSITTYFEGAHTLDDKAVPKPQNKLLTQELGAFVTLKKNDTLRGCIGNVVGQGPLYLTVARMARAAAFEDPRFPQVSESEFAELSVEISIMGPITICPDTNRIEIGIHGLIIRHGAYSGLLLPQVAKEWHWDRKTFLEQTCIKAGLKPNMWEHPSTKIYWFEAYVF
ncbi:AmmeMemoRadiSam system protein A [Halodesulfovibrio aestuarii]|uniref:AmmeMemoRadiSam system protein A n=1 Tax=Halodesulfovibrio aestuarii TaxID=126333 RepID=UPI0004229D00